MLLVKAKSLLLAIWSFLRWGDAPIAEHDQRATTCYLCEQLIITPQGIFCSACNCPRWPLSDLRTKWRLRDLRCPRNKW
jgi:hypothetical protein